ncbi:starch binding domain protein [bacterium BMS3Abin03]|nr:starch binding domain protein [bacterium BMS3Abin03]HDZ58661.1 T9SS type A sorting domain-containing protein [Ignavibacteriales bacterium]
MKKLILMLLVISVSTLVMAQNIPVTFQCDMGVQVFKGNFDPAADVLVVRGDFQIAAGDTADWSGDMWTLDDSDGDTIYTITIPIPQSFEGNTFEFKYVISPDGWEGVPNRSFTLTGPDMTLPVVWFSDDNSYVPFTNTIIFTADIGDILGIGAGGAFDGNQDSLLVMGLDWEGGSNVQGNRRMVVDDFNAGIYRTTLSVEKTGDSTKWKFKAFPDNRFSNGGWETGEDRWYIYQGDGETVALDTIVPRIYPIFDTLANDINVTFNVDMSAPVNRFNGELIDPSTLEFVGMRGGADFLGNWGTGGTWTPDDTTTGLMKVLTDMGNNIWSRTVFIPGGTQGGGMFEYKFAMMYPGADTVNGGSTPLDNEGGFGVNHSFLLVDGPDIVLDNVFGDFTAVEKLENLTPVRYDLQQNYPNPFNPSTKIRYTIPEPGLVTLKVYNLLGQEVATLINEEQTSGVYEVTFDAKTMASGIYFYTLNTGKFVSTKKMILLK